jgi:hypothetical protein
MTPGAIRKRRYDQRKRDMAEAGDALVALRLLIPRKAAIRYLRRRGIEVRGNAELAAALEPVISFILGRPT